MWWTAGWCFILASVLWLGVAAPATGQGAALASGVGEDRVVAASEVRLSERTPGDLLAAGGRIEIGAPVDGDAVLAGGELRLRSSVAHNVYAAGGRLQIDGALGRHLRAAGGQIELAPGGQIAGNATLAGGDVAVRGPIKGSLRVGAGRVLIDAAIDGDVHVTAGRIELGPQARIGGALRWRSGSELQRDAAAKVAGPQERIAMPGAAEHGRGPAPVSRGAGLGGLWWTAGLMLVAAALLAAFPAASARIARTLRERAAWSLLIGFVVLVCVPAAALVLLITVIGAPLALIALLSYFALLLLGYVACATALGDWGLARWRAADAGRTGWRIGAAWLALLLLALLGWLPWAGGLAALAAMLAGLGAIALQFAPALRPGA